jgi:hypothetical protein
MLLRRAFLALCLLGPALAAQSPAQEPEATWPEGASEADLDEAQAAMASWIAAYQTQDFAAQWRMTDPRIRRWFDRRRWTRRLARAFLRNGKLLEYAVDSRAAISGEQLPRTEQGHRFRPNVSYVIFLLRTQYEVAAPPQPEFCVIARSDEGWRFGGGTILNRPLGKTAVIMTEQDERRYEPSYTILP